MELEGDIIGPVGGGCTQHSSFGMEEGPVPFFNAAALGEIREQGVSPRSLATAPGRLTLFLSQALARLLYLSPHDIISWGRTLACSRTCALTLTCVDGTLCSEG